MNDVFTLSNFYMITGFLLASYSVVANDSMQTLGTLINSQRRIKWYFLWLAASLILAVTLTLGWYFNNYDFAFGRLEAIPRPENFYWFHMAAPLVLVILTKFGMPVSTTFLVLSVFATDVVLEKMIMKSVIGYGLAAVAAYFLWLLVSLVIDESKRILRPNTLKIWGVCQLIVTGILWASWLVQDMANIVVYLPRKLNIELGDFVEIYLILGLALVFYFKGGKIGNIIANKSHTKFTRSATVIDLFYSFLLIFFTVYNNIPMSTSWVFVGLLCGREFALKTLGKRVTDNGDIFHIVASDLLKLIIGMLVSIALALTVAAIQKHLI
jgi:phosphate/sulfate permease